MYQIGTIWTYEINMTKTTLSVEKLCFEKE